MLHVRQGWGSCVSGIRCCFTSMDMWVGAAELVHTGRIGKMRHGSTNAQHEHAVQCRGPLRSLTIGHRQHSTALQANTKRC